MSQEVINALCVRILMGGYWGCLKRMKDEAWGFWSPVAASFAVGMCAANASAGLRSLLLRESETEPFDIKVRMNGAALAMAIYSATEIRRRNDVAQGSPKTKTGRSILVRYM
jgi:hypothetical protein